MEITSQQIKDALIKAKSDPVYGKELQKRLETGKFDVQLSELGYRRSSTGLVKSDISTQPVGYSDTGADIKQIGSDISSVWKEAQQKVNAGLQAEQAGQQTKGEGLFQAAGAAAGAISGTVGAIVKGGIKAALPQEAETAIKQTLAQGIETGANLVSKYEELKKTRPVVAGALNLALGMAPDAVLTAKDMIEGYSRLKETNPRLARSLDGALGIGQLAFDVATAGAGKTAGVAGKEAIVTGVEQVGKQASKVAGEVGTGVAATAKGAKNKLLEFIAPEIDTKTANMLKQTPTQVFDDAERVAKAAAESHTAPSSFEVVGEKLANATKQLDNQTKSYAKQASTIIGKAKNGLVDFTKETGEAILDINRSLKDSKIGKQFIEKLKTVTNKIQAGKTINELQDMLYKGNKDMTIPMGSAEDKALRAILGKYNTKLKAGLPKAYGDLNKKMWENLKATQSLNRALGEVVEGVSTRGSGLVKQFFSPSGTKAKELFAFLKAKTGIDIAQEATVARFMAELHGDVRARLFLEGIPTSTSINKAGAINKAIEFGVEKTGLGTKLKEATTSGAIKKGRSLTKKAK